jgi:hypothetical protein
MDALEAIAALQQAIQENRIGEETTWTLYEKIEYAIDFDPRSTAEEKQSVVHLGEAMGKAILQVREHDDWSDGGMIGAILVGLQHSVERRTTGVDGRPLRH